MSKGKKPTIPLSPLHNIQRSSLVSMMTVGMRKGIDDVKRVAQDKNAGTARIVKLK